MLALVLLAVGAAALSGGMRSALRSMSTGRAWSAAAFAAESRFEQIRSRCLTSAGASALGAVNERWSVGVAAGPLLPSTEVTDSLTITLSAGTSSRAVQSIVRCVP